MGERKAERFGFVDRSVVFGTGLEGLAVDAAGVGTVGDVEEFTVEGEVVFAVLLRCVEGGDAGGVDAIDAAVEGHEPSASGKQEVVDLVRVAIVFVSLLPGVTEHAFAHEHGERLRDPVGKEHVEGDVDSLFPLFYEVSTEVGGGGAVDHVEVCAAMEADGVVGVGLHEVDLFLEFERVCPVVVAFAVGDKFPFGMRIEECDSHATFVACGVLVGLLVEGSDSLGILFYVVAYYLVGTIGGGIVVDDDFGGEGGLLHEHAFDCLADVVFLVIGQAADADERLGGSGCRHEGLEDDRVDVLAAADATTLGEQRGVGGQALEPADQLQGDIDTGVMGEGVFSPERMAIFFLAKVAA